LTTYTNWILINIDIYELGCGGRGRFIDNELVYNFSLQTHKNKISTRKNKIIFTVWCCLLC